MTPLQATDATPGPVAPGTSPAPAPAPGESADLVRYVFAVGRRDDSLAAAVAELRGPTGSPVRAVHAAGLTALVCEVPSGLYDEEGLRAQLEDLERLEALARSHHAVVAAAYERATVLPMRLATLYLDDERVAGMLAARGAEFDALLSRLEGHIEWGVKVYADPRGASPLSADGGPSPHSRAAPDSESPGRAYLRRRRESRRTHQDTYRAAGAVAERIAVLAGELAAAKVAHRPQQGELAQEPGENVANDAYLVAQERSQEFGEAVGKVAEDVPGVRVALTGPWAPYSFATPPERPAPEGERDGA